jgi:hypothetical protein
MCPVLGVADTESGAIPWAKGSDVSGSGASLLNTRLVGKLSLSICRNQREAHPRQCCRPLAVAKDQYTPWCSRSEALGMTREADTSRDRHMLSKRVWCAEPEQPEQPMARPPAKIPHPPVTSFLYASVFARNTCASPPPWHRACPARPQAKPRAVWLRRPRPLRACKSSSYGPSGAIQRRASARATSVDGRVLSIAGLTT